MKDKIEKERNKTQKPAELSKREKEPLFFGDINAGLLCY